MTKTNWDLSKLFSSIDDPKIKSAIDSQEEAYKTFIDTWEKRSDYLTDVDVLKEALDQYELLIRRHGEFGAAAYYLYLQTTLDQVDPTLKALYNNEVERITHLANSIQFFTHRLSRTDKKYQEEFVRSEKLKKYRHFLEELFAASRYLLSEEVEKVINLKSKPAYSDWVDMVSEFISTEERVVLGEDNREESRTFEEIMNLISSTKKDVRDKAADALNDILRKNLSVATKEMNAILYNKKIDDTLRKAPRPDTMRMLKDDFEPEILETALSTIEKNFELARRYYALKAKLFGLVQLEYHERNVPYGELSTEYSYEQSVTLVEKVFSKLDPEFSQIFTNFVENGHIDVYPQKGKLSGAYCIYDNPSLPVFVMLNHTNKLQDVITLAHEMGHAINGELMKSVESALDYHNSMATAEVASTFMEDFVIEEILQNANKEERLSLMMLKLNEDISSVFRQTAAYRFEQELHNSFREKGYLSENDIGTLFQKHMRDYMGEAVRQSEGSKNWWVYWSHFRSFFYVYSYACGQLISKSLQRLVRNDTSYIRELKGFFRSGATKSPKELFMDLGLDISQQSFWEQGIQEIKDLLVTTETLAKELGKTRE